MASPFVAEIRMFAGNFAPTGWATCDGQLLPLSQNTALFSLLGTTYGGNGKSNFALPDLQGCAPLHPGQGNGLVFTIWASRAVRKRSRCFNRKCRPIATRSSSDPRVRRPLSAQLPETREHGAIRGHIRRTPQIQPWTR